MYTLQIWLLTLKADLHFTGGRHGTLVRGNGSEATEDHKIGLKIETGGILLEPGVPSKKPTQIPGHPRSLL